MTFISPVISYPKIFFTFLIIVFIGLACSSQDSEGALKMGLDKTTIDNTVKALVEKFGEQNHAEIETGVKQAAQNWAASDGTEKEFEDFCLKNFITDKDEKIAFLDRYQQNLESYYGNLNRIRRQFRWALDVDRGEVYPIDYLFVQIDPFAHQSEDVFNSKIAFAAALNYPIETLESKNAEGMDWSREKWAEVRLVEEFITRVPADVSRKRSNTYTLADDYIANYNIYMHQLGG